MNSVVNLEIIDRTLQAATKEVNRSKQLMEMAEENLTRSVEERDGLKWVVDADADLASVEKAELSLTNFRKTAADLNEKIVEFKVAKAAAYFAGQCAGDSERLLGRMQEAGKAAKRAVELLELLKNAQLAEAEKLVEIPDIQRLDAAAETMTARLAVRQRIFLFSILLLPGGSSAPAFADRGFSQTRSVPALCNTQVTAP